MSASGDVDTIKELKEELEEVRERAERAEASLASITGMERTRLAEVKFKEGFDKGFADGKASAPPPKAKQMKAERDVVADALRSLRGDLLDRLADTDSPGTRQTLTAQVDMASAALAKVTR